MPLSPGTRLGRYEIVAPLGAGGMGEVYRAHDTRLGRAVAIKTLHRDGAANDEMRARFRREAESIAALKHPHVCVLYDVVQEGDVDFLVMEHLEGETLHSRLKRGPLPIAEVIERGIEIASALAAAHGRSFVHRDLKPGNVMLTAGGAKVLDFGLAKPLADREPADSIEVTRTGPLTVGGAVLGTLGYMSPEQLEGRPTDARSDLFALGALLWEMATARPVYEGATQAHLIAAMVAGHLPRRQPNDPPLPRLFERIVFKCLAKDPERRWQSASDVADALRWVAEEADDARSEQPPGSAAQIGAPRHRRWISIAAGAALLLMLAVLGALVLRPNADARSSRLLRLSVVPPTGMTFPARDLTGHAQFALSPDGSRLAFVAAPFGETPRLWVRSLESAGATAIPGSEGASSPFWSPDGQSVGFFAFEKLRKAALDGTAPQDLAEIAYAVGSGSWSRDGVILFSRGVGEGLYRVAADGGPVETATTLDVTRGESSHRVPQFLPDGRRFLFYVLGTGPERTGVYLGSLDSDERVLLLSSSANAVYAEPGYLLFERNGQLTAQRFDWEKGALTGEPTSLSDRIVGFFGPSFLPVSAGADGTLAYWAGEPAPTELQWFDRTGRPLERLDAAPGLFGPVLSPDGSGLAFTRRDGPKDDIWRIDLASGLAARVTFSGTARFAIWSSDSRSLAFSNRYTLYRTPASGGEETELLGLPNNWLVVPEDWSRDGRWLIYTSSAKSGWDVLALDLGSGEQRSILDAAPNEVQPRLSPAGDWLAYASSESGRWEVYAQPFPSGAGKWQISEDGGSAPQWRDDGRELFYIDAGGDLIAVPVSGTNALVTGSPQRLFATRTRPTLAPYRPNYAVGARGERFLVESLRPDADPSVITVVLDWPAMLLERGTEAAPR